MSVNAGHKQQILMDIEHALTIAFGSEVIVKEVSIDNHMYPRSQDVTIRALLMPKEVEARPRETRDVGPAELNHTKLLEGKNK